MLVHCAEGQLQPVQYFQHYILLSAVNLVNLLVQHKSAQASLKFLPALFTFIF